MGVGPSPCRALNVLRAHSWVKSWAKHFLDCHPGVSFFLVECTLCPPLPSLISLPPIFCKDSLRGARDLGARETKCSGSGDSAMCLQTLWWGLMAGVALLATVQLPLTLLETLNSFSSPSQLGPLKPVSVKSLLRQP